MQLTRRSALALAGAVSAIADTGPQIEPAIVQRHDDSVEQALRAQITDPASRGYGNVPHLDSQGKDLQIYAAGSAGGLLESFTAAFLYPSSRFHRKTILVERMKLAAGFLERAQHEDGLIDYQDTNFDSAPDTAFTTWSVAAGACLAKRARQQELFAISEPFLRKAANGLLTGGIHTPNHRWVVSSALAQIHELLPNPQCLRRIYQWLAEGIDIDADGQYSERSTSVYNTICDRSLLVLAVKLKRPELLEPVRRNLRSMLYLMHPDCEVVTEVSRRQDRNIRADMGRYWFPLRYLAVKDGDGQFAAIAQRYTESMASLSTLMEYPEMIGPIPEPAPLPDSYTRTMKDLGIVRFRRGPVSSTVIGGDATFFTTRKGEAVVQAVRFASAFFGKGQFMPALPEQVEGGYILHQALQAGYYQPLDPPQRVTSENWGKLHGLRKETKVCQLQQRAEVVPVQDGFDVHINVEGTPKVPVAIEVNCRDDGEISGCEVAAPGVLLLPHGYATYTAGQASLRIGPGLGRHRWTQLRGALPKLPGRSIYLTGFSPLRHTLEFRWS